MTGSDTDMTTTATGGDTIRWRRKRVLIPLGVGVALVGAATAAWLARETIAGNIVDSQLSAYGIPASYKIARITGQRQVLNNLVVGDPAHPDLTVEQVEVRLVYGFGTPRIGKVTLLRPRLYGRLVQGRLSFGSLDKVLYRKTGKPPALPKIDLTVRDGRALLRTPYGPVGGKLDGAGLISDGFDGTLALAAPALAIGDCHASEVSLYGHLKTSAGKPGFYGPARLGSLACANGGLKLANATADIEASSDGELSSYSGRAVAELGGVRYADYRAEGAEVTVRGKWKQGLLDASHTIAARGIDTPQARAALVTIDGTLRAGSGFADLDWRSDIEGNGLRPGPGFEHALAAIARSGQGTLIAPLAQRFAAALAQQARGSAVTADLSLQRRRGITSVIVPHAEMRGGSGARILSLSRVEASLGSSTAPHIAGNLATGGPGMPQIAGRMESAAGGGTVFRLVMQPYSAGTSSLAVPRMSVVQAADGGIGFSGSVRASGPLPGGTVQGLALPVSGRWSSGGTLALWRSCVDVGFDRLELAQLSLTRRNLTLCPSSGRAIVENGVRGLRVAAGAPRLDLAGTLGKTPIRLASGPVGFAYPGVVSARSLAIALGPEATASRFTISNLTAKLGGSDIAGNFDGADVRLNAVPLNLENAAGTWRYADGALNLTDGSFRLVDRNPAPRFEPLTARGASLGLADNVITAEADLRNPATDALVTRVALVHDLSAARGHADLTVPGLAFGPGLQPQDLSRLAKGVIANASGTITGTGRIDWKPSGITSSGDFSSDNLDFAAAFGPVKGAKGTVHFTDLIGLTTAPGQTIKVASVNPGIEVDDGEFTFQLRGGRLLAVEGGSWPFMGGQLILRKVDLNFGEKEERRYVFDIRGLDAAAFIARMNLPNIAATGIFDGTIPIVFDANGNGRIEGGMLTSRPPGGNVSYVGDLTYKDLSPIANFAFDALRSLDYETMGIAMNGPLTGEIVTNVRFDGVKQGKDAKRSIITRALAGLPIQFKINITAPFYQLITSFKSLRDPAAVRDPRDLGLLSDDGKRLIKTEVRAEDVKPKIAPEDIVPAPGAAKKQNPIQH